MSFQGEGAYVGQRHLFIRLAGCNLRCTYCDTPDSLERSAGYVVYGGNGSVSQCTNPVAPDELVRAVAPMIESDGPIDAIALTGGEPLTQSEFLAEFLRAGRFPCPILLETNGVLPRRLRDVLPLLDIISMDMKPPSNTGEGAFWEEHAEFIDLARSKNLYVKILVDQWTEDEDVTRGVSLLAPLRPPVPVFLQPIVDPSGRPLISVERLTHLHLTARRYLQSVRVVPQTHKLLGVR